MCRAFTAIIEEVKQLQQQGRGAMINDLTWDPSAKLGELWSEYEAAYLEGKERLGIKR